MTALLGGSILAIAASAVALVLGWLNAEETYIWGSIGATVLAAVLLVLAYVRSRGHETAYAAAQQEEAARGAAIDPEIERDRQERSEEKYARATTRGEDEDGGAETQVLAPDAPPPPDPTGTDPGFVSGATMASPAPGATAPGDDGPAAGGGGATTAARGPAGDVVAIPRTKKFHRTDCRFAGADGARPMTRSDAEEQNYDPCGVCKP